MNTTAFMGFIGIAGVLTLLGLAWMLRPLWRERSQRLTAGITAVVILGATIAIYQHASHWSWPADDMAADNPRTMVSRLARRLEREPNDVQGWLMLGRSYAAIGQMPLAQRAYQRADRLENGQNAEALIGMAEAMVVMANGQVDARSGRLFEQALALEPESEKALFFSAVAAQRRGEFPLAISRFEQMLALGPPENIRMILQEQINRLRSGEAAAEMATEEASAPSATASQTPRVIVAVSVTPPIASRIEPGATLFVFVRAPGRPGPPLAVKRLPAQFPVSVELTPADSMVPGVSFAPNDTVEVSAKVSNDGSATPRSGDPFGSTRFIVGRDFKKAVVIDGLTP